MFWQWIQKIFHTHINFNVCFSSEPPLRRSKSLPLALNLCSEGEGEGDINNSSVTPEATSASSRTFTCNTHSTLAHMLLIPPTGSGTSGFNETTLKPSAGRGWGLGRVTGWLGNSTKQTWNLKKKTHNKQKQLWLCVAQSEKLQDILSFWQQLATSAKQRKQINKQIMTYNNLFCHCNRI